jgi:2-polyprenyl-3-methyl-5-hydroxy-6-metoxy-1,4-benzoquinol methylase
MLRSAPDFGERAQLTELMDEPCRRDVLRACLRSLARTNRLVLAHRPTLLWLESMRDAFSQIGGAVRVLDVGCGYGDGLRRVERWAKKRGVDVKLTGLDLNPDTAVIAKEASPPESRIQWVSANVFEFEPEQSPHVVMSSQFTHHLSREQIVRFVAWMEQHATAGWFINDLSRAAVPYYFFKAFAKIAGMHEFVQHDGPVSIARSFVAEDWRAMCADAGLKEPEIEIRPYKPARLCVARRKAQ